MRSNRIARRARLAAIVGALAGMAAIGAVARADNPAAGTIPSTGQSLNINITSPADGTDVPALADLVVEGVVGAGSVGGSATALYVIDVSGSTSSPSGRDCNGNGTNGDAGDNLNGDGTNGDVLDCEIAGVIALNNSLQSAANTQVGIVTFGSTAKVDDVGPDPGQQNLTAPAADANSSGGLDIDQVARSNTRSQAALFTPTGSLGNGTNFENALNAANSVMASSSAATEVVFFLSDGDASTPTAAINAAATAGTVVHTFAVNQTSCTSSLNAIANGTGGTCTPVANPQTLAAVLAGQNPAGIDRVEVSVDGGTPVTANLDALGNFDALLSGAAFTEGSHQIEATVFATDGASTSVTADVTVNVRSEGPPGDPSCSDGLDNDGDDLVDQADTGCQEPEGPESDPTCSDGVDNDGDTLTDALDPDCAPEGPAGDPSCSDGADNDGDGAVDQADSGCQSPEGPFGDPSCSDTVDNDGDSLTDAADPDCVRPEGPPGDPTCSDGDDNDGDTYVDQLDPGCQSAEGPPGDPSCADGVDNDGDGATDGADTGCIPVCAEDGLAALDGLGIGTASGLVHQQVEPLINDLLGSYIPQLEPLVHDINCQVVVPLEDLLDSILVPLGL